MKKFKDMKKIGRLVPLTLILSLSSCVFSLFPIYTADSLVHNSDFEGIWTNKEGKQITVTRLGRASNIEISVEADEKEYLVENGDTIRDKEYIETYYEKSLQEELVEMLDQEVPGYLLVKMDKEDTIPFRAHLASIGKQVYLDLYPYDEDVQLSKEEVFVNALAGNWLPVHTFMKVDIKDDQLVITEFDLRKLQELFRSNRIRLRHEEVDDWTVITAQPEEIQKFLSIYSEKKEVFEEPTKYVRVAP